MIDAEATTDKAAIISAWGECAPSEDSISLVANAKHKNFAVSELFNKGCEDDDDFFKTKCDNDVINYISRDSNIKNFTRPTFNNTKTYTPIVIPDGPKNDVVKIVAIIMSTIVGLIILVLCMYQLGGCKCRRETIRANEIFPN